MNPKELLSPRPCPVCLAREPRGIYHQEFSEFSEGGLMTGYHLAICGQCGAAYADDIPPQEAFDHYYAEMSKYEHGEDDGVASPVQADRYRQIADLLAPFLSPQESIADIGCATGALLGEFKRRGFSNLFGIDPSPACAAAGMRHYSIPIRPMPIECLGEITERFDTVILIGVLEHLCDMEGSLNLITSVLKPGGRIYVEVPDATRYDRWFSAPFQFFSMEHINFFSPQSLANLMAAHGFQATFVQRAPRFLGPKAGEPAVAGLFHQHASAPGETTCPYDSETEPALRRYIASSNTLDGRIRKVIDDLVSRQIPLLVWGAGTHTLRLLKTSSLAQANILAFVDSNNCYQGKRLQGIPILSPDEVHEPSATILISSHVSEQAIEGHILQVLKWTNPLICLYEDSPTEMPEDC